MMIRIVLSMTMVFLMVAATSAQEVSLKVGDSAPDWTLTGSDGKSYTLSNFKGKQGVVVAWYPMALTGG